MRIASGVTDEYIYFIALSSTDGSRLTGLSSFTIYRSRNGGAATAMTNPTINETSSANMPGVYELLLDEDMTIDAGDYTQAMVFHITATGMQPVTREIELFSPAQIVDDVWDEAYAGHLTAGTFGVVLANLPDAATTAYEVWQADPSGWSAAAGTFGKLLIDAETDAGLIKTVTDKLDDTLELDTSIYRFTANALEQAPSSGGSLTAADVWAYETRTLTAGTNIVLAKGTGVTGFNDLSAAQVNAEVDTAISDVGLTTTITGRIDAAISSRLASASYTAPDNASVTAIKAKTDNLPPDPADASDIAAAFGTVNTNIYALNDLSEADIRNALGLASANLDTQLKTVDDNVDAVKAKTDQLVFTVAGQVDANTESMNAAEILGDGTAGNLWRGE